MKFTPSGGVEVSAILDQQSLMLRVADSGIGIDAADHRAIFDAFSQVDGGMTRQFSGTGLGLSIVHSLIERLEGRVEVESAIGTGATFTVHLPVEPGAQTVTHTTLVEGAIGLDAARILLIDSDMASQPFLRILLAAQAAAVEVAEDLADAEARIATGGCDCVLFNVGHALDGAHTLAAVRALAERTREATSKLVLLQSLEHTPSIGELMTVGADQLIVKPIAAPDLMAALSSLWSDAPAAFVAPAITGQRDAA